MKKLVHQSVKSHLVDRVAIQVKDWDVFGLPDKLRCAYIGDAAVCEVEDLHGAKIAGRQQERALASERDMVQGETHKLVLGFENVSSHSASKRRTHISGATLYEEVFLAREGVAGGSFGGASAAFVREVPELCEHEAPDICVHRARKK